MNLGRVIRRAVPLLIGIALALPARADESYAHDRPYYAEWGFSDGCCDFHHDRIVFERRRIEQVDKDVRTGERLSKAVPGQHVDSRCSRCGHNFVTVTFEKTDNLGADQTTGPNNGDVHMNCLPSLGGAR